MNLKRLAGAVILAIVVVSLLSPGVLSLDIHITGSDVFSAIGTFSTMALIIGLAMTYKVKKNDD